MSSDDAQGRGDSSVRYRLALWWARRSLAVSEWWYALRHPLRECEWCGELRPGHDDPCIHCGQAW